MGNEPTFKVSLIIHRRSLLYVCPKNVDVAISEETEILIHFF